MDTLYDVIIVGSGPAGMTSAIYASRNNLKVMIVESSAPGGQMINTNSIENYPGYSKIDGATLAYSMYEQVVNLNVDYLFGTCSQIIKNDNFIVNVDGNLYESKNVIIATGAKNRKLNVDGEAKFIGRGISYCAICDGYLYKGKTVAVIGGGSSSLQEAIYLSTLASTVYLIHRRDEFRAEASLVQKVKNVGNIHLITNSIVEEFIGQDNLKSIRVLNTITKEEQLLDIDGCFEFIGMIPTSELVKEFNCVNEAGYIVVDHNFQTSTKGLYAIGDVIDKDIRQIVTACNDGAIASMHIIKEIK